MHTCLLPSFNQSSQICLPCVSRKCPLLMQHKLSGRDMALNKSLPSRTKKSEQIQPQATTNKRAQKMRTQANPLLPNKKPPSSYNIILFNKTKKAKKNAYPSQSAPAKHRASFYLQYHSATQNCTKHTCLHTYIASK